MRSIIELINREKSMSRNSEITEQEKQAINIEIARHLDKRPQETDFSASENRIKRMLKINNNWYDYFHKLSRALDLH